MASGFKRCVSVVGQRASAFRRRVSDVGQRPLGIARRVTDVQRQARSLIRLVSLIIDSFEENIFLKHRREVISSMDDICVILSIF